MLRKQPSIEEQGGIDTKLDNERGMHNGFGSREFRLFVTLKIPNTIIARLMGMKDPGTIRTWKTYL